MSKRYHCGGCDTRIVIVDSGGVSRSLICNYCNSEMEYETDVETEYVGHEDKFNDYQIVRNDE